jgi:catechol 2,3-dioxygenase-like lactoylglutathione lyase family enzyme
MFVKLTPNLMVPDVDEATGFYEKLGFTRVVRVPAEGDHADFAILLGDAVELMLQSRESIRTDLPPVVKAPYGGGCILYLEVDDILGLHASLADQVEVIVPMRETFYGSTEFYITDPNGYTVGFAQPNKTD